MLFPSMSFTMPCRANAILSLAPFPAACGRMRQSFFRAFCVGRAFLERHGLSQGGMHSYGWMSGAWSMYGARRSLRGGRRHGLSSVGGLCSFWFLPEGGRCLQGSDGRGLPVHPCLP